MFHAEKEPAAQIAHLVFADTQAFSKKPKKQFFTNALKKIDNFLEPKKEKINGNISEIRTKKTPE